MRYEDVAILVADIHRMMDIDCNNPSKIFLWNGTSPSLIREIKQYYSKQGDSIEIESRSTDCEDGELYGLFRRYRNETGHKVIISINSTLNTCWSRFVEAKELAHTIMSRDKSSRTTNLDKLIIGLLSGHFDSTIGKDIEMEQLAVRFAIDILVPPCFDDFVRDPSNNSYDVAKIFMVPERIIDLIRDNDYFEMRKEAYRDLYR
jgi:Zn-dependent peptidase ImmA (M78 family)